MEGLERKILKCLRMSTSTASQTRGRILPLGNRVLEGKDLLATRNLLLDQAKSPV